MEIVRIIRHRRGTEHVFLEFLTWRLRIQNRRAEAPTTASPTPMTPFQTRKHANELHFGWLSAARAAIPPVERLRLVNGGE